MPLLNDAKKIYVGTKAITTVMAGTQQVWPKGPPPPSVPVMTQMFYGLEPSDGSSALSPVLLGDISKRYALIVEGVSIDGIKVRYAIQESPPKEFEWIEKTYPYRNRLYSSNFDRFTDYRLAINTQEASVNYSSIIGLDLGFQFSAEARKNLWMQTSYMAAGFTPRWVNVQDTLSDLLVPMFPYAGNTAWRQDISGGIVAWYLEHGMYIVGLRLGGGGMRPGDNVTSPAKRQLALYNTSVAPPEEMPILAASFIESDYTPDGEQIYHYKIRTQQYTFPPDDPVPAQRFTYRIITLADDGKNGNTALVDVNAIG